MILSLIAVIFILLIAAFWAFQGLFSSAIMFVETLVAAMVAFGFYHAVHGLWAAQLPDYGEPLALVLLFVATLTILRVATDSLIPGNVQFPLPVDRAGGGLLGFLSGMIIVGTVLVAVQMLPLGGSVLGFERYTKASPPVRQSIWLNPDGFVVGFMDMTSTGRFGARTVSMSAVQPALLDDLYASNAGFQVESRVRIPPQSVTVKNYWEQRSIESVDQQPGANAWIRKFAPSPLDDASKKFLVCRIALDPNAADDQEGSQRMVRFTPAQFRIVGRATPDPAAPQSVIMATGMSDLFSEKVGFKISQEQASRLVRWPLHQRFGVNDENAKALMKDNRFVFDVAFEVPQDFQPSYIKFKAGATADLPKSLALKSPAPPLAAPKPPPKPAAKSDDEDEDTPAKPAKGGKPAVTTKKPAADDDEEDEDDVAPSKKKPAKKKPAAADDEDEDEDSPAPAKKQTSPKKPAAKKPAAPPAEEDEDEDSDTGKPSAAKSADDDAPATPKVAKGGPGRTGRGSAIEERTGVTALLPRVLDKAQVPSGVVRSSKFHEGHIVIETPADEVDGSDAIKEFEVPDDLKLVQIGAEKNFAQSLLGRALEYAKNTVAQITIQTESGETYFACGVYAEATVDGKRILELQYWPQAEVPERCLEEPRRLKSGVLRGAKDLKMGFLFLVKPGSKVTRFSTSRRDRQDVEIEVP